MKCELHKSKSLPECRCHFSWERGARADLEIQNHPCFRTGAPMTCGCQELIPQTCGNCFHGQVWQPEAPHVSQLTGRVSCCDNATPTPLVGQEAKSWRGWWTSLLKVILCSVKNTSLHAPFYKTPRKDHGSPRKKPPLHAETDS